MGLGHQEHGESRWSCTLQHQRLTIQGGYGQCCAKQPQQERKQKKLESPGSRGFDDPWLGVLGARKQEGEVLTTGGFGMVRHI
jgi:hypothetical protein